MQNDKRFLTTVIIYTTAMILLMTVQILASLGCFHALSDQWLDVVGSVLPQIGVMFGVPLLMMLAAQKLQNEPVSIKKVFNDVGWHRLSLKNVALVFLLGICLYILNIFVAGFFSNLLQIFGYQYPQNENAFHGYDGLAIMIVLSAVLPAICEEFLHRGVLLNGMIKQFGVHRAILLTSLLFGLMHMNIGQFFYATVLGWFLCVTTLATGSLWSGIIVHFVNNALATYMSYADELTLPGASLLMQILGNPLTLMITIIVVIVAIGKILRYLSRERFLKHLDTYTVRYLSTQQQFTAADFDRLKVALPRALQTLSTWKATAAYIETFDVPQRVKPLEKAILMMLLTLGLTVTAFTFVWGTW